MNDYEALVDIVNKEVPIKEISLKSKTNDTAYFYRGTIFIDKDLCTIDKKERLYEEYGHYKTSTGIILSQNVTENRKQEKLARNYGSELAISLDDLIASWKLGHIYYWECAEFLGFTSEYVYKAIQHIKEKNGVSFTYKNYQFNFVNESSLFIKEF